MPTIRLPEWMRALLATFVAAIGGVAVGAWVASRAYADLQVGIERAAKLADETAVFAHALEPRVASLETSRAVQDERWTHVLQLLEELRRDVKELKSK